MNAGQAARSSCQAILIRIPTAGVAANARQPLARRLFQDRLAGRNPEPTRRRAVHAAMDLRHRELLEDVGEVQPPTEIPRVLGDHQAGRRTRLTRSALVPIESTKTRSVATASLPTTSQ